ncbi:hypothetical protein DICSQDRAFT_141950 [Dichomitus squalens LYAD-421 SS1]|uniref:Retrotransposon gag domain-containing protein n=1 Tax=Dichomitus squalens (strain LYAD-421) TaxID=732165 RepID=R7SK17_DICSQ|nr:uncharacterized protein DICSQDRAFT_141950 [Dichomitus squalens LYAD-421 SS1]EJF55392.1 hypothetical protein DICSQDRAFT_141950 [Dichomitus squalens LYAD-421 SS1]
MGQQGGQPQTTGPANNPQQTQPGTQTATQPPDPMTVLLQSMTLLTQSMAQLANSTTGTNSVKAVQKPSLFKGGQGGEARRFLAAFTLWAMSQGSTLNHVDATGNTISAHDDQWIRAVLSFMQDSAALWATPAMEEITQGTTPFKGLWTEFRTQFKARFETVDEAVDAKERLRTLWQGSMTVPEYAARFNELSTRTGYSKADLRDCFYEHLADSIKDELVHTARPIASLEDLITVRHRRPCPPTPCRTGSSARTHHHHHHRGQAGCSAAYHPLHAACPGPERNGHRREFNRLMHGKCYGCGSTAHVKKDGGHNRDICGYCRRVGHRETVCMDKFLKKPRSQKLAATEEGPEEPQVAASTSTSADAGATNALIAQLMEQQKALADQLASLQKSF